MASRLIRHDMLSFLPLAMTEAQAKKELAEKEEDRLASGGVSLHAMSAFNFVALGLDLEDSQYVVPKICPCALTNF